MKKIFFLTLSIFFLVIFRAAAQEIRELAIGQPSAVVDLKTTLGLNWVKGSWRFLPAEIQPKTFHQPGPSAHDPLLLYPTGEQIRTADIFPRVDDPDFDHHAWNTLDPSSLEQRRGNGLLSFNWYRLKITLPDHLGDLAVQGTTVVFEIVMDDYAEIWVNGHQSRTTGQSGQGVIAGWNARNRVILTDKAQPGDTFDIAVLGINGPIGALPSNYVWIRSATLDVYPVYPSLLPSESVGQLEIHHPALAQILDTTTFQVEKIADGFQFTEGPVWHPDGYLLFSDPNANVIYRYDPSSRNVFVYMTKSGYSGVDIGMYHQPGSNGLALDAEGRLVICQHGNHRIVRIEPKGPVTDLADAYMGKRLNSPNDLVVKSDNSIYFTDPPYGLPLNYQDKRKELSFQGVYRIRNGETTLLTTALGGPNGLAFSPDEKFLYVGNWDIRDISNTKTVWRFRVLGDGTLDQGQVFYDFKNTPEEEGIDGIKVDQQGNLFVSAPGGLWILDPNGQLLGKVICPQRPANMAWGEDGRTLFLTAHSSLYKMRVRTGVKIQS